jgi:prepilin-type N-terminal cleavage/methylation domain-containing protein
MFRHRHSTYHANRHRRGLTLLELLLASSVMALFAAVISALALAVQQNSAHNAGVGTVTQHARVSLQRIERAVSESTANEHFPGCVAFGETIGSWEIPDTLVVWRGDIPVANPGGRPLVSELVIYCPDPYSPNRLLEITAPDFPVPAPPLTNGTEWAMYMSTIKYGDWGNVTELTDQLRAASVDRGHGQCGAVRFDVTSRPSDQEWANYQGGSLAWEDLTWAQGIHSQQTGLRQTRCGIELQLTIEDGDESSEGIVLPFVGSASKYYALRQ